MTPNQEEALYEFLDSETEPFTIESAVAFVRMMDHQKSSRLAAEITALINSRNIAFRLGERRWVSRRGCFESAKFVISPGRVELLNGILIPGHRCIPYANPLLMPHELSFFWKGTQIPVMTSEGPPEDFYPYYTMYGEEYAAQYVARDNPDNEDAYNADPQEEPPEVSVHILDMRAIYRETGFVPGDRFVASCRDWRKGAFDLERAGKGDWSTKDIYAWVEAAEAGFAGSFNYLGPGVSTDEQIAFACWYGGERMRDVPALSLEEFLYEKSGQISMVPYGLETRFWYAGKEIPDRSALEGTQTLASRTYIEEILYRSGLPVSEYVIQSYVLDALYRKEPDVKDIVMRIVPQALSLDSRILTGLAKYVAGALEEMSQNYNFFADQTLGPIRRRAAELHTAVVELWARLMRNGGDTSWLPRHTFIMLSQIHSNVAGILEDCDTDDAFSRAEIEGADNFLDSMIDTYEDIREMVDEAHDDFRRNSIRLVKPEQRPAAVEGGSEAWRMIQVSLGGMNVWRRLALPGDFSLEGLHRALVALFGLDDGPWRFVMLRSFQGFRPPSGDGGLLPGRTIGDLAAQGVAELRYEYSGSLDVKILFLSATTPPSNVTGRAWCIAGAGTPPSSADPKSRRFPRETVESFDGEDSFSANDCSRLLSRIFPAGGSPAESSTSTTSP